MCRNLWPLEQKGHSESFFLLSPCPVLSSSNQCEDEKDIDHTILLVKRSQILEGF